MVARCPRCRRVPHRHDRCPVCRTARADLEVLRRFMLDHYPSRDAAVLDAAERYERAHAGTSEELQATDGAWRELATAHTALLAAVRARRAG